MASIELKSISCKGVKSLVIFQKPSLYAVVSLSSGDKKNKKKTPVDRTNGENPDWDQAIRLDISTRDPDLILQFDLKAEAILGDRLVGKARIPVADLDFSGSIQHASYQLRTPDGKPNGVLNFSYWIGGSGAAAVPPAAVPAPVLAPTPTPVVNYSPPPSAPAPVMNYSPPPSAPSAGFYPEVSYPPSAPPVPVSASGYYPASVYPPEPLVSGYYPPPPVSGAAAEYYPPPAVSYPPPPVSAAAANYYPPPPPAAGYYPPPGTPFAAYPPQQSIECQQEPECCYPSLPQPAPGWGYPRQPPAPCCYPSPATCCYPSPAPYLYVPQGPDGYRQDCWDRGLYGYN